MENTKLYIILSAFDKYEHNRLYKYICSPYFNKHEQIIQIYEILRKHIFAKRKKNLDKEGIWNQLYGGTSYNDVKFRKLLSDLLKLVEGFLAQQIYEDKSLHQATYLMEAVGNKDLKKLYNSTLKTARRLSEKEVKRPAEYYLFQYQIEKNFYELTDFDLKRSSKSNVDKIVRYLDYFYLAEKLRYYCLIMSQQSIISHDYKVLFIDEIIKHVETYGYQDVPPIAIYYLVYLALTDKDNEENYYQLVEMMEKYESTFPKDEAFEIYDAATNFCIGKVNRGDAKFLREYFNLTHDLLEKNLLFPDGYLSPFVFRNIVFCGLRLGEFKSVKKFIDTYNEKLAEEHRSNAVSFNMASWYFYQKKYDEVISMLQEVEYDDFTYNLNSKVLLLITYYETDEQSLLDSFLDTFKTFLRRNKSLNADRKNAYMDLVKFTQKLLNWKPGNEKYLQNLKQQIADKRLIANKNWLMEKIAELEA